MILYRITPACFMLGVWCLWSIAVERRSTFMQHMAYLGWAAVPVMRPRDYGVDLTAWTIDKSESLGDRACWQWEPFRVRCSNPVGFGRWAARWAGILAHVRWLEGRGSVCVETGEGRLTEQPGLHEQTDYQRADDQPEVWTGWEMAATATPGCNTTRRLNTHLLVTCSTVKSHHPRQANLLNQLSQLMHL